MDEEIPSRARTHTAAFLIGALEAVPGGAIAGSMLNASLARASEERMRRLISKLEERILRSEKAAKEPRDPAVFSAVFNMVALEASRTYSDEKIDLLGSLLSNSFGWDPADWQLNQRPLDILVALPESELRVLIFVSDPQKWMNSNGATPKHTGFGMTYSELVRQTLCRENPQLREDVMFSIEALTSKLLIGLVDTETLMTTEGLLASRTTKLGERVLELGRTTTTS